MESNKNMKCWNYNACGHELDSLCPTVHEKAGNSCWLVEKTLCGGKVHGERTQKTKSCEGCAFYIYIHLLNSRPAPAHQPCPTIGRAAGRT